MVFSHNTPIYVLEFYLKPFYVALQYVKMIASKYNHLHIFWNGSNETCAIYTAPPAGLVECKWNKLVVQLYWLMDKFFFLMWLKFGFQIIRKLSQSLKFPFRFYFGFPFLWFSRLCWTFHLPQNLLVHCGRKSFSKNCVEENLNDDRMQWLPHTEPLLMRTDFLLQTKPSWWMAGCLLASPPFSLTREQTSPRLPIHPLCPQLNWDCASEGGQPSRLLQYDWGTTTALWSKWLGASH